MNGGEGLMAYKVTYIEEDAVALYKRIILIVSRGDSAETRVKPDGSLSLFKVRKTTMDVYAEATENRKQESFENLSHLDLF